VISGGHSLEEAVSDSIRVSDVIKALPERIYDAWLSSAEHSAFTTTQCAIEPTLYGRHSEGDGYIEGVTLEFVRGRRSVQTWRSTDFPPGSPDSQLEVLLEAADGGTRVTFVHTDIPSGQGAMYEDGWRRFYLEPMKQYFAKGASGKAGGVKAGAKKSAAKKGAAKKGAAKKGAAKKGAAKKGAAKKGAAKKGAAKKGAAKKSAAKAKRKK
jgi:uncharacterized protein YndB with AHSA1/START domain